MEYKRTSTGLQHQNEYFSEHKNNNLKNTKKMKTKKMKFFLASIMVVLMSMVMVAFAQVDTTATGIDASGMITAESIGSLFATIGALGALVLIIVEFAKSKGLTGYALHWASWVLAFVCAVVGKLMGLGMFDALNWGLTITAGFFAGTAANGVADWQLTQVLFGMIKGKTGK